MIDLPPNIAKRLVMSDGCWSWKGEHRKRDGRAMFNKEYVYRILYKLLIGPIPDGMILHHRVCNRKPCVNPWHTVPITQGEHLREHGVAGMDTRSQKTHCLAGHPYDLFNTIWVNNGKERVCRECRRQNASKQYYANLEVKRQKARRISGEETCRTSQRQSIRTYQRSLAGCRVYLFLNPAGSFPGLWGTLTVSRNFVR